MLVLIFDLFNLVMTSPHYLLMQGGGEWETCNVAVDCSNFCTFAAQCHKKEVFGVLNAFTLLFPVLYACTEKQFAISASSTA